MTAPDICLISVTATLLCFARKIDKNLGFFLEKCKVLNHGNQSGDRNQGVSVDVKLREGDREQKMENIGSVIDITFTSPHLYTQLNV